MLYDVGFGFDKVKILLKSKNTGLLEVKTIESLSEDWVPYEEFKPWDTNRKEPSSCSALFSDRTKPGVLAKRLRLGL